MKKFIIMLCAVIAMISCTKENANSIVGTRWAETSGENPDYITFDSPTVCRAGFISSTSGDDVEQCKGTYEYTNNRVEFDMQYYFSLFGSYTTYDYATIDGDVMTVHYTYGTKDFPSKKTMTLHRKK